MAGKVEAPPLEVYYMKILSPTVDARLGKLKEGDIRAMDRAKATRFLSVGAAEQVAEGDFQQQQERQNTKATAAQNAFRTLNEGSAVWDVATYRDVLTAPEGGLRLARERGIPLVNVHVLRDEDGDPLPPDADIDDILDARANLHPDLMAPFAAHDRSSVMGGGSPYANQVGGYGAPMPLSPQHRAQMERVHQQEVMAQESASFSFDRNDPKAKQAEGTANAERANRAARRAEPRPQISPDADKAAADAGVTKPSNELKDDQKA